MSKIEIWLYFFCQDLNELIILKKICPTYPKVNIVPKAVEDSIIKASSQFRAGGRFPVLSYYHKKTKV